ncbi:hypothetical protein GCM10011380_22690 [Sphingomonas metalli]|uniref:Peptidase inhibitor I78 family protein n=1 Tax=Sphingomonas metalli TaxID=1779358 RepID=A0A916WU33_9SPHN|nr:I78 family peptidase inhibitor [Sphingomonas metalli]GGB32733.1 hypothetical protein GCM10011380_22690 [Sphingomonas metalli]
MTTVATYGLTAAAMIAALAGCATTPPPREPAGPCRVDEAVRMRYVGTRFRLPMRDEMRYATDSRIARVIRPGDITTQDFREDRLNILVDDARRVEGLRCG